MARFGQYLRSQGLVTAEQLEEALGQQAVQGARLGTNLVELGALSIEQLAQHLSAFQKAPLPPRSWLEKPQRAATQRVTRALVERIRFVPLRLEGKVLHAALLDTQHPHVLDDLRFATGCRIEPYVLPEIWMHDWLLELFGIPRGIRQVEVRGRADDFNAQRPDAPPFFETTAASHAKTTAEVAAASARRLAAVPSKPPPVPKRAAAGQAQRRGAPQPAPERAAEASAAAPEVEREGTSESLRPPSLRVRARAPRSAIEETSWALRTRPEPAEPDAERTSDPLLDQAPEQASASAAAAPAPRPEMLPPPRTHAPDVVLGPGPSAEPATDADLDLPTLEPMAVARELSHWEEALATATDRERLIELALSIAACFATRVALFTVHQGKVQGLRYLERSLARPIDGVVLPLTAANMLSEVATRAEPARVDPRARPADVEVCGVLADGDAVEVALFPIAIKQRVVNVLYGSNGSTALGPIAFGALQLVAQEMGRAYGRLILSKKAGAQAG